MKLIYGRWELLCMRYCMEDHHSKLMMSKRLIKESNNVNILLMKKLMYLTMLKI